MSKKAAVVTPDPVSRFEGALKELDEIVVRMERGDLALEESLGLFERGVTLTRECREALVGAELRVRNLLNTEESSETADPESESDAG